MERGERGTDTSLVALFFVPDQLRNVVAVLTRFLMICAIYMYISRRVPAFCRYICEMFYFA